MRGEGWKGNRINELREIGHGLGKLARLVHRVRRDGMVPIVEVVMWFYEASEMWANGWWDVCDEYDTPWDVWNMGGEL